MKKVISIILVVVMLCSTFAGLQITSAAADLPSSGSCGENVTYTFDSATGLLTISGSGAMKYYSYYDNSPFYNQTGIKTVVIESGVTSIGSGAFYGCSGLTSITIPDSVTSIGEYAFSGCSGLTSVTIGNSVTSMDGSAFNGCSGLTSIAVASGNTKYDSRNNCNAIIETKTNTLIFGCKNTVIPDSVTGIGMFAFSDCKGLTSVTIPDSVTSIGNWAFSGCSNLAAVNMGSGVKLIGKHAFDACENLKKVNTPSIAAWSNIKFDVSWREGDDEEDAYVFSGVGANPLSYAHNLYVNNKLLTELIIPYGTASISDYAYYGCTSIKSVQIPNSVTYIGEGAFSDCSNLKDVYYWGSAAQWKNVNITTITKGHTSTNKALFAATIHYSAPGFVTFRCTARTAVAQKVEWNAVAGAAGYQVQISNAAGTKWAKYYNTAGTSFVFKNLAAGSNYKFRVRFVMKAANGKVSVSAWKYLASPTLPKATSLAALAGAKKSFGLSWYRQAVSGYQVQFSTNAKFTGARLLTIKNPKQYKALINKLSAKKVYFVRIRTYKTINKANYFSTWSKVYKVKTK